MLQSWGENLINGPNLVSAWLIHPLFSPFAPTRPGGNGIFSSLILTYHYCFSRQFRERQHACPVSVISWNGTMFQITWDFLLSFLFSWKKKNNQWTKSVMHTPERSAKPVVSIVTKVEIKGNSREGESQVIWNSAIYSLSQVEREDFHFFRSRGLSKTLLRAITVWFALAFQFW